MLRLRAWVFFGVLLLIGIVAVGSAPSFQSCLKETAPPAADSGPQKHGTSFVTALSPRGCLARFYTENRDDIIPAIALILALSTIFLWFATRDLVASSQDFSKMQLRAYLGPSEIFITGVAVGERPVIEATVRNFGQTPAYRARYWSDAKLMDTTRERFERIPYEAGEKTINPGRDGFAIKSRVAEALTEEDMSKIKLGTASIYFYGLIIYRDAFGRSRKTQFRLQHGGPRLAGSEDLTISPKGNKAT